MKKSYRFRTLQFTDIIRLLCVAALFSSNSTVFAQSPEAAFDAFLQETMDEQLARYPQYKGYLGMPGDNDKWDDISIEFALEEQQHSLETQKKLHAISRDHLTLIQQGWYDVMDYTIAQEVKNAPWIFHNYSVSQLSSPADDLTTFLVNIHKIENIEDAEAYITRVKKVPDVLRDMQAWVTEEAKQSIRPPDFAYPKVIENTRALLKGVPFEMTGQDSTILADFRGKLEKLDASEKKKQKLQRKLNRALKNQYQRGLTKLIAFIHEAQKSTTSKAGVWKLPKGKEYYAHRLATSTTTNLSAEDIHARGLTEVARIHKALLALREPLDFEGNLQEFFQYMRNDPKWYYPETDEGRTEYLDATQAAIDRIELQVDRYFNLKPKAGLEVRRVEAYREKNTSAAFYNSPSLDGSRPGIYYVPLYKMKDNPKWDMITTAYHEATPGHHMQIAIAQELPEMPLILRMSFFGAYVEGWALYAEQLAAEMGMYEDDPVGEFGRLASELFRAVRLVVDTGIHTKKWSRQTAIQYMLDNTPLTEGYISGEVERYIVWPGQATSYKVGMMKILELRQYARDQLGNDFDIRLFHDVVLSSGQVPMSILQKRVESWVIGHKAVVQANTTN